MKYKKGFLQNVDKKKNRRNAIIAFLILLIPLYFYISNNKLKIPALNDIKSIEIISKEEKLSLNDKKDIEKYIEKLKSIHGKYLVLGVDGTKILQKIVLNLVNDKKYEINLRDATVEFNGNLYDISPDNYANFIKFNDEITKK